LVRDICSRQAETRSEQVFAQHDGKPTPFYLHDWDWVETIGDRFNITADKLVEIYKRDSDAMAVYCCAKYE
jgi:hypothetical protein